MTRRKQLRKLVLRFKGLESQMHRKCLSSSIVLSILTGMVQEA